jgi:hypothetical protein
MEIHDSWKVLYGINDVISCGMNVSMSNIVHGPAWRGPQGACQAYNFISQRPSPSSRPSSGGE